MAKTKAKKTTKQNFALLPAKEFRNLGTVLFGEHGWQRKLAKELKTDPAKVSGWAKKGAPHKIGKELTRIAVEKREAILYAIAHPDMPLGHLPNTTICWERLAFILEEYDGGLGFYAQMEKPSAEQQLVRLLSDVLRYCAHQNIPFDPLLRDAQTFHNVDEKDLIAYVLAEDTAQIDAFKNKFNFDQDHAVDVLIEYTGFGDGYLRHLYRRGGTPFERLQQLRTAIIEREELGKRFWEGSNHAPRRT
jgi:hypothetical protein